MASEGRSRMIVGMIIINVSNGMVTYMYVTAHGTPTFWTQKFADLDNHVWWNELCPLNDGAIK